MNQKEVVKKSLEQMHLLPNSLLKGNPIVLLLIESICGSCDLIHRIVETAECFKSLTVNRGLLDRFLLCAVQPNGQARQQQLDQLAGKATFQWKTSSPDDRHLAAAGELKSFGQCFGWSTAVEANAWAKDRVESSCPAKH